MQHVGGDDEASAIAAEDRLVQQVLRDHRLADPVRTDQDDVSGLLEEVQSEKLLEELAIDLFGPGVIEVRDGFELEQPGVAEATLQTATLPFAFFDLEHALEPGLVADLLGLRQQAVEVQALEARPQHL